ncbi:P-loop containing nucleoside triphosphate hydrolase protein, partial [Chytridium lagenaria]
DVWATVVKSGKESQVLENVSGYCKPGESLIIYGPFSSLLDTLGFRKSVGKWGGDIRLNGSKCTKQQFIEHSGYVTSDEVEIAALTVQETLPSSMPWSEKQRKVNMHLTHRATCKVGSILQRGLSTGERKRLSIAIELLTVTSVLFLDEPTTGLDSNTGREIITRQLASVMTIHQPSYQILQQFDRLHLLAKGRTCYFGPTLDAIQYFENLSVKIVGNPAEVYAEILAEKPFEMAEAYLQSELNKENVRKIDNIHNQMGSVNLYISAAKNNKTSSWASIGIWQQAPMYKQPFDEFIPVYCCLGTNVNAYDSKLTLAFALSIFPPLFSAAAIPHWLNGRKLYYLQVSAGFFHPFCWILVSFLVECFFCSSMMVILGSICLSLAGWDTNAFGLYLSNLILEACASVGFAMMVTMGSSIYNLIFGGYYVLDTYSKKRCDFCDKNLTLRALRETYAKFQVDSIANSVELKDLNNTDPAAFKAKFTGLAGYGLSLSQLLTVQRNIKRVQDVKMVPNFPSSDYTSLLSTVSGAIAGSLVSTLNIPSANLTESAVRLVNSYTANFLADNIKLFSLPTQMICPFANGSQYLAAYAGFTDTDGFEESPESKYQGVMAALAIISFLIAYLGLTFCKNK